MDFSARLKTGEIQPGKLSLWHVFDPGGGGFLFARNLGGNDNLIVFFVHQSPNSQRKTQQQ